MARPLSTSDGYRNGHQTHYQPRYSLDDVTPDTNPELDQLRAENAQLRQLCTELEQALNEAVQPPADVAAYEDRLREYEVLLESKDETIRQMHVQLQGAQLLLDEAGPAPPKRSGPVPPEDELLALSEELERERRQLQEDEQALMEQMRQMEMGMARERAEMARQRNDLQRLAGEVRHELERLERNGALQNKMEELRSKLQDATNRRGAAPSHPGRPAPTTPASSQQQPAPEQPPQPPQPRGSFMGRLFGGK